eukprot:Skav235719  [mRNA]  locus=scaffold280:609354:610232:+ [translate_table: standard]
MESKDARLFRRFDGCKFLVAFPYRCRFLVAFPYSTPIADMTPPFVVLDGLNSASNVGQVLRSAYHLGINSVIASPGAWSCLNGRACRVSMGWFYRMSFHVARPLSKAINELKDLGVVLYAAENQFSQPVAPHKPHGDRKWALVIGSEFSGVSEDIVRECDQRVCVPQQQGHSLNVAHACSICLYELSKFNVMSCEVGKNSFMMLQALFKINGTGLGSTAIVKVLDQIQSSPVRSANTHHHFATLYWSQRNGYGMRYSRFRKIHAKILQPFSTGRFQSPGFRTVSEIQVIETR